MKQPQINIIDDSCKTKYPIMLIHGTGSRDRKNMGYWGRIYTCLKSHGAEVFCGNQDAFCTLETAAKQIKVSIENALKQTGAKKINLIAHSKGGLDARYLISSLNMAEFVASLSTISTPHHGSKTVDFFYGAPKFLYKFVGFFVNLIFRILGDKKPDFYKASREFSTYECKKFNEINKDMPNVYYQSYATKMSSAMSDILLAIPYTFIKHFDGDNDGIVPVESMKWGYFAGVTETKGRRGVSHADIVDMRRRDVGEVKIAEFYLNIVRSLKNKGL